MIDQANWTPQLLHQMVDLFMGNPMVVGLDDDGYGKPGPMRLDAGDMGAEWLTMMDSHLRGDTGIGVYPYNNGQVHWGCVDLDAGAADWASALNLYDVLRAVHLPAFIERSRSKGFHVWVLVDGWVPATDMRHALMGACLAVGANHREVNPKQVYLADGQIGNFVRLPYKGGFGDPEKQVVVDLMDVPLPIELFLSLAETRQADPRWVARAAMELYQEPMGPKPRKAPTTAQQALPWRERLDDLAKVQLDRGPRWDHDRSQYLYTLGMSCARSGLDEDEIATVVATADELHCDKYVGRPDAESRYRDIARKAVADPW